MSGYKEVRKAFEHTLGIKVGEVTSDMQFGLFETSCIGLSDQGPAAIINHHPVTRLTPEKVPALIRSLQDCKELELLPESNIHQSGPVFFQPVDARATLSKLVEMSPNDVIDLVEYSGLRGQGGAGFATATKWDLCRQYVGPRYLFANGDEGEPGTFKDRAILTESPEAFFLGMIIAGYAIEAYKGFLYLRAEYFYLKDILEDCLKSLRRRGFLGQQILGSNFSFEIKIKYGAGAYICGEESALIESAEGKRGEPRNRPPFPVEKGYLGRPTVVNNIETLTSLPAILNNGHDWYRELGTEQSSGTKLLSIAGDCARPGVYEVEFGITVREVLELAKADISNTQAVQVGGPSGTLVSEGEFERIIGFEDIPTGGAVTIFSKERDLLTIVKNYANFFMEESCGFCVPCRAGTVIINELLDKTLEGKGVHRDMDQLRDTSNVIRKASRCGLGKTAVNPILQSLEKFESIYLDRISKEMEFISEFDLQESLRKAREGVS
jgi:[NiFe] hydrogenase diaphorase moiety large subunit